MTRPRAIALRVAYRLRYLLTGSGVLAHGHLPTASAQPSAAADRDGPPDTAAASSRASRSGEYQTSTLYVAEEELARRTALKNARKAQLLDDNPYVKRLEIVMRRHISSARHVSFVLMPMNTAIDVDRLGLDPSIPAGVAQRIVALGTRHGFAVHDLGALWEGKFFANEDVVHLNRQGSMQAAAMLARSSAALAGLVPTVRTRPIIGLIERYRASVGAETFARTLQLLPEDESFRLVALGDAHAYLATSLERPFLLTAVPYAIGPGEPPRIRIVRESGEIAFDAPLREGVGLSVRNGVDEIEIAHAGLRIRAADPAAALTFGYVDQASADRECFIRVDRIFEFEADPAGPRA